MVAREMTAPASSGREVQMVSQGNAQPVRASLKIKAITYISLLILIVGAVLSWYFLRQTQDVLTAELHKRAASLTMNLAHNSKYGVLTEDGVILQDLIAGLLQEADVLFVSIADAQGKVLAQGFKDRSQAASPASSAGLAQQHVAMLAPSVTDLSIHYHVIGEQGLYHAAAPVETTETGPGKHDRQLATAMVLLGTAATPEASDAPKTVRRGSVQIILSPESMQANVRQTFGTGIGLTLGIILVALLLSFAFCNYTLTPVQAMARAASRVAAGDLSQRVEAKSRDEIGVLAMTFNHMTSTLDQMTQAQQQRLAELSALHAIGLVTSSTLDLEQLIDSVLEAIVQRLGYDRAKLFLVDAHTPELVDGRIAGATEDIRAQLRTIHIPLRDEGGFLARVALTGEPVLVEDLEHVQDHAHGPLIALLGTRALVAVPLKVEGRLLGVLSVDNSRTERTLTAADQRLLVTVANQVATAIANALAYQQIEQLNVGLEEKVQERTEALQRQQATLQEMNLQLEIANRHKSEFLANMSHELRTPLNAVIGFSEVLLEQMFGTLNAKQAEYLDDILSSGKYLLSLINDILDLAKIEAGKLDLELGVVALRQLLEGSLVMVKERALAHGIALSLDMSDDLDTIMGDERKIKQILFNLLSNAVKFTPDKGRVGIKATRSGDVVQIAVWDTGVGIAPYDQQRIFEAFQQVGQGLTRKTEGTGLGLTLTKKFVELHGGTVWVESALDHGSTFTFTLPIDATSRVAALAPALAETPQQPPAVASRSGAMVLVIEDDSKSVDLLRIYLTEAGYAVEVAQDGAEGLEKVKRLAPDVVILDVLLPKVDGWAFLSQVKSDPATRDIPVIIVSIVDQKGKGFALGAADYLIKPINKEELLRKLAAFSLVSKVRTTPVKILTIDDDPRAIDMLAAVLEPEGFQVLRAAGGAEGIALAEAERPDLIILDLLMPGMNGFEVLDHLGKSPVTKQMPIILFTVKQLTAEEKRRVKGRITWLAQKEGFQRQGFVDMVKEALHHTLGSRK
jgi:signal transduction histidine kinase/DNA-binding response OmpR family regulator/HAMP domain-containing protein